MRKRLLLLSFWVLLFAAASCDEDEPITGDVAINNWIYENMDYFYYWTNEIPQNPNKSLPPDQFFESLLSDKDRFSWIEENYEELLKSLQGINKEAGFEFVLYLESENSSNVIMQITYIKPNSPASSTALKRGDVITAINEQTLTQTNYRTLLGQMGSNYSVTYRAINLDTETFGPATSLNLVPVEYSENPNYLASVIEVNNKKVGYYLYNFFATGAQSNSSEYNNEMDAIFAEFKAQGITDLVLDLRFNSGGAETATRNLASLIAPGVTTNSIFAKRQYNAQINEEITNDPDFGPEFFLTRFLSKSQNVGNQLDNFIILTGPRTASASELLINGLRPYMNVFLIGDVTFGKNVGSISLYEEDNPANTWGMQPIVVKSFNANDESDYSNGFIPDITLEDNSLYLYPLGNVNERLLSRALEVIAGQPTTI
ncbi:MAG: S41 family peptidase, partial [Cyclobacteriaceae bacterium]|nr:S41 family peptidase [Cyclobacteriaceae bacterium]